MQNFTLSPKQIESIQKSTGRQSLWCGAVRSGKTFSSILRFISLCQTLPKGDALICGVSRDTIQRNVLPTLCELCNVPLPTSKSNTMMLMGRRVHLLGAPDESAVRRIKGATLALAYLDELTDIPEPFYKMILSRLSVDNAKLIATTNPESPTHWLKERVIDNDDIDLNVFYFGLQDNPVLSEAYKEELTKEYSGVWYDRYILGKWTRAEGVVFDGFNYNLNVVDEIKRPRGIKIAGIDYGTTNPTCVLVADIKVNEWPQIYIEKEWYFNPADKGFSMTDGEQADAIEEFLKHESIEALYVDPAAASIKLELQRKDLPVINANNDVLTGIKHCNKFLSQLNIVINRSCKNLIKQLQSYSWDPKKTDRGLDEPIKKDDHACFIAGTRVLTTRGNIPIESVAVGDIVKTRSGWNKVEKSMCHLSNVKTYDLNGKVFRCTPDHKFFTVNGWKEIEKLDEYDILMEIKEDFLCHIQQNTSFLTEENTHKTNPGNLLTNIITDAQKLDLDCIEIFGDSTKEKSLKGMSSIISTTTQKTIAYRILNVCHHKNILNIIRKIDLTTIEKLILKILKEDSISQKNGIPALMGENGILYMLKESGLKEIKSNIPVKNAEMSTLQVIHQKPIFVRLIVGVNTDEKVELTMRLDSVFSAIKNLEQESQKKQNFVQSDAAIGIEKEKVYNLQIENEHEFYVENILTHNCDAYRYLIFSHFPNGDLQDYYDAERLEALYKEAIREQYEGF